MHRLRRSDSSDAFAQKPAASHLDVPLRPGAEQDGSAYGDHHDEEEVKVGLLELQDSEEELG
ncbi:MAG: hypothetical protein KTR29_07135, partial [Rhodothermaceae bacterium]|nr:hypothetical protein [Rhodothermaceae bacterium]